ncbi:MAG: MBL fold metallo-hydrolase RNA specificity domain-containing protein [Candidatus Melainabacteria bacterium]
MKLTVHGAARQVTGSCHLVESGSSRFLLDCGAFQGGREDEARNRAPFPFDAASIDAVVLSHAHLDHAGLLPRLVLAGFRGRIYTHPASVAIARILLRDSAHIHEKDAQWENRKRHGKGKPVIPVYTMDDVEATLPYFEAVPYQTLFEPCPGVRCRFQDAGHILGSAIVECWLNEPGKGGKDFKVVYSGDLGHSGAPILRDPMVIREADLLIMESTYGDRSHRSWAATWEELGGILSDTNRQQGNILIPAFAIGRVQELLAVFKRHLTDWGLDAWRIFLDSPMALEATRVYDTFTDLFDAEGRSGDGHPFQLPNLSLCRSPEESMALNRIRSGAIIIAGSGMCTGGRIRHHLRHNLGRRGSHVILTGFQARGTLGRQLVDGARSVRLFGEQVPVQARVHTVNGLSAHADQSGLLAWAGAVRSKPPVVLVHGEEEAMTVLADALRAQGTGDVHLPRDGECLTFRG